MKQLVFALALLAAPAAGDPFAVDDASRYSRGGFITDYYQVLRALDAARTRVEITARTCQSACTMFLAADNVCVAPDTVFRFHGASYLGLFPHPDKHNDRFLTAVYARKSPALARWFRDHAAGRMRYSDLTGAAMIDRALAEPC